MDVKTGDILSMVSYPNFDLNEPGKPTESSEKKKFNKLSAKKQTEYVMDMWRNKNILSTYDPGSVFKLITAASAIENNAVARDARFYCDGAYKLYDRKIRCWNYPKKHGYQNLREGVRNSCNPVMIQVVQKLGLKKFYQYLELFGITEKTGIDYPAEAEPLVQTEEEAGPVGLATMSFGQGLAITPIQLVAAIASMGNDGKLMRPNLVKKVVDTDGETVYKRKPEIIRQVISQSTAKEVQDIMVYVAKNSIKKGLVKGYTVGGKTGTTQKLTDDKEYSKNAVVTSVVEMAPMESPKYLCYIQVDDPIKNFASTGYSTAPFAGEMMKEVLEND
jgi:stage V sporulation protein D (sporulation-specific penicillin-binding protein)